MPVLCAQQASGGAEPARSNRGDAVVGQRVFIHVHDEPIVALTPLAGRVLVGLVMPGLHRVTDVSIQPGATVATIEEAAAEAGIPMSSVDASARRAIAHASNLAEAWLPDRSTPLAAAFSGIAFPLLAAAYGAGAAPVVGIPRWAESVLSPTTIGSAAVAAFGSKATKPVRRALVEAIRPTSSGRVDLAPLAMALMATPVVEPDRLARILRCESVDHPSDDLPDPSTISRASAVLVTWGSARTERLMLDAAARPDGLRLLLDSVLYAQQLRADGPSRPLPNRLAELHDAYRVLMVSAPAPAPPPEPAAPPPRQQPAAQQPATQQPRAQHNPQRAHQNPPHPLRRPPTQARPIDPATPIGFPPRMRELAHRPIRSVAAPGSSGPNGSMGSLAFVLPRTIGDLQRWGRLLSSCIGDFAHAVDNGHSFIIGVENRRRLSYAIELTSRSEIRQFAGHANRRPNEEHRAAVIAALIESGVIDPLARANQPWLVGIDTVALARVDRHRTDAG